MTSAAEQLTALRRGTVQILSEEELKKKLELGRPLRVKLGVDPTAPDIHIGHAVPLQKLRQFQEFGHQAVLIIGDFTAQIGDPSGRNSTRPPLTHADVMANAETFMEQAFLILDKDKTEVVYNGSWFGKMNFNDVIKLNSRVTMQQMLQREDFRNRIEQKAEVRLHEIQYPIMQGWDSVEVRSDVELGGTDQLFNLLVGRDFQKAEGLEGQVAITLPLLEGLDGVRKMSKSYGNYIGLTDAPGDMFGKIMSISDDLMPRYYQLVLMDEMPADAHPLEAKKQLATRTVTIYHDAAAAAAALENWDKRGKEDAEWPEFTPSGSPGAITLLSEAYSSLGQSRTSSEIRRLLQQGSIQLNGEKLSDPKSDPPLADGDILKLDKKHSVRIKL